ncbi:hypothetical protein LXL04_002881 [Taraxacum kok-saghyz]
MITGFKWGRRILPKTMFKPKYILTSSFRPRVFDIPDEHVFVNDLLELIMDYSQFGGLSDGDAVRVVQLFILCRVFLSKEIKDMVCREWFILADDFEAWNSFPWGTFLFSHTYELMQKMFGKLKNIIKSGVKSKIKYTVLGFTLPFKIWIWEMMPELMIINSVRVDSSLPRMTRWRQTKKIKWEQVVSVFNLVKDSGKTVRMRQNMIVSEEEKSEDYYLSFLDFMTASSQGVPDAIRGFMKNEFLAFVVNESASSPIPPPSPRTSPDPPPRTSPDSPPRTSPPRISLTIDNYYMADKFDSFVRGREQDKPPPVSTDDYTVNMSFEVMGKMDNLAEENNILAEPEDGNAKQSGEEEKEKEAPQKVSGEEEEEIHLKDVKIEKEVSEESEEGDGEAEENEDYDIKQIDMSPKSFKSKRTRKPSQAVKSPYTEAKPKKRNRKGGARDVTADFVGRDYSDYKLQPYVFLGEKFTEHIIFRKDTTAISHRALNRAKMCPHFWGVLIGEKENGWLENTHIAVWVNLLNEKWQPEDDWTIMSPNYFTLSRELKTWISCAKGDDKDFKCRPWKDVDRVFIPINITRSHWILGELSLQTMKVRVFDSSLSMRSLQKLVSDRTTGRFQEDLVGLLDGIDYWSSAGVDRKNPKQLTFENVKGLPQQSGILGDCRVFLCIYLEQLVSGIEICDVRDTESLGKRFRIRMGKIFYGSTTKDLKNALPTQATWLDNITRDKWAMAYFPCIRFNVLVATIPDAISLLLFDEQNVPIECLIDAVRHTLQVCVNERSRVVIVGPLTPFAERVYRRRLSKAERCEVRHLGNSSFEVSDYDQNFILDYSTKDCSCGKWRKLGIQCRHATTTTH